MAFTKIFLIIVIICSTSLQNILTQNSLQVVTFNEVDYDDLLARLINALDRLLEFFSTQSHEINLDGAVGLRIAQGQLNVLLRRLDILPGEQKDLPIRTTIKNHDRLIEIHDKAEDIAEDAIPYVAKNNPDYYERMKDMLSNSIWEFDIRTRVTDQSLIYSKVLSQETINETASDYCIREMTHSNCNFSDLCWVQMTQPSWIGYSLTHQILYVMLGEKVKCGKQMQIAAKKNGQTSTWRLINVMCANVVKEMNDLFQKGLSDDAQDLFMEQAAICGMLGFRDTFSITWLNAMISWQKPEGCYGSDRMEAYLASILAKFGRSSPSKREEKVLTDGCLSHKSAVAAGALAVYARYVLESQALSIYGPPILEK